MANLSNVEMIDYYAPAQQVFGLPPLPEGPDDRLDVNLDGNTLSTLGFQARTYDRAGDPSDPVTVLDIAIEPENLGEIRNWAGEQMFLITLEQAKELLRTIDDVAWNKPASARQRLTKLVTDITGWEA